MLNVSEKVEILILNEVGELSVAEKLKAMNKSTLSLFFNILNYLCLLEPIN